MNQHVALITQYIRENRHTYTRAAIDRQLLERGYAPADIASAWELIEISAEAYGGVPQGKSVFQSSNFWGSMVGFVLTLYLVPFTLGSFFPGLSIQMPLAMVLAMAAILALSSCVTTASPPVRAC